MSTRMFSLEGKVAVVTGASRGIGRALALGLAEAGADVCVAARTEADLAAPVAAIEALGRRALAVPTDVCAREQIEAMIDRTTSELGRLDILVNNAGGTNFRAPIMTIRPEGWDKVIALNLTSAFHATQIAAQVMSSARGGSIIQISSVAGLTGAAGLAGYSAAKAGVRLMSQAAAKELARSNVRVNTIAPGWVATELNRPLREDEATDRQIVSGIPMGRWGRPEEIVGAAVYLASDASSFVTGATLVVDGGETA